MKQNPERYNKLYKLKLIINDDLFAEKILWYVMRSSLDNREVVLHLLAPNIDMAEKWIVDKAKDVFGKRCKIVNILSIEEIKKENGFN